MFNEDEFNNMWCDRERTKCSMLWQAQALTRESDFHVSCGTK